MKKKSDTKLKIIVAVVVIIVLIIFTLPETIKKYNYTKKIEKFESLSFTKTYTKTTDITLLEPASWFMGFISYAEIVVAPDILAPGLYQKFFFNYYVSKPKDSVFGEVGVLGEQAWCEDKKFSYTIIGGDGYFRMLPSDQDEEMDEKDFSFYCSFDWSEMSKQRTDFNPENY